jgi:hypothetical protein
MFASLLSGRHAVDAPILDVDAGSSTAAQSVRAAPARAAA